MLLLKLLIFCGQHHRRDTAIIGSDMSESINTSVKTGG